jgi:hypothetical protein
MLTKRDAIRGLGMLPGQKWMPPRGKLTALALPHGHKVSKAEEQAYLSINIITILYCGTRLCGTLSLVCSVLLFAKRSQ